MSDSGPPIKFVVIWGLMAVALLYGQRLMIDHGYKVATPYQIENADDPTQIAMLD